MDLVQLVEHNHSPEAPRGGVPVTDARACDQWCLGATSRRHVSTSVESLD